MLRKRTFAELAAESATRQGKLPITVILHNIRSQYNVGAILRTADAVGVSEVWLSGYTPLPEQSGVKKTALRGLAGVKCKEIDDILSAVSTLKAQGYTIYGLEQCHESVDYNQINYQFPLALIVGEEVAGIDQALLDLADQAIEIPMFGQAHSLNVSVASGVILYQLLAMFRR